MENELAKRLLVLGDEEATTTCKYGMDDRVYPAEDCPVCGHYHHLPLSYDDNGQAFYRCPKTDWKIYGIYA